MTDLNSKDGKCQTTIPATLEGLAVLMNWVEDWTQTHVAASEKAYAVRLIVEEISSNAIRYGYEDGQSGHITASLWGVDRDTFGLSLKDDGRAFDPLQQVTAPDLDADLDERAIGGLGVYFAVTSAKDSWYERRNGHNWFEATI